MTAVGVGVKDSVISTTAGFSGVGVSVGSDTGTAVKVGEAPPRGVGVAYWPHKDALPTQEAVRKETAINNAEIRLTFRPF
jgi:hypothetical protein